MSMPIMQQTATTIQSVQPVLLVQMEGIPILIIIIAPPTGAHAAAKAAGFRQQVGKMRLVIQEEEEEKGTQRVSVHSIMGVEADRPIRPQKVDGG